MTKEWRILIADDVLAIREGVVVILASVPGVRVTKVCATALEATSAVRLEHFDLAMLDLQLGEDNGIVLGRTLRTIDPELKIITYTKEASIVLAGEVFRNDYTRSRMRNYSTSAAVGQPVNTNGTLTHLPITFGLHGYLLLKNITPLSFAANLDKLQQMGSVVDSEILDMLLERLNQHNLTPREMQCSELVSEGKSNKEIAEVLGIGQPGVENLISSLYSKLAIEGEAKDPGRRVLLAHAMLRWRGLRKLI